MIIITYIKSHCDSVKWCFITDFSTILYIEYIWYVYVLLLFGLRVETEGKSSKLFLPIINVSIGKVTNACFLIRRSLNSSHRSNKDTLNSLILWKYQLASCGNRHRPWMAHDFGKLSCETLKTLLKQESNSPFFFPLVFSLVFPTAIEEEGYGWKCGIYASKHSNIA